MLASKTIQIFKFSFQVFFECNSIFLNDWNLGLWEGRSYEFIVHNFLIRRNLTHKAERRERKKLSQNSWWWCECLKQVIRWYICFEVAKQGGGREEGHGSQERWPQSERAKSGAIRSGERSSFCEKLYWALPSWETHTHSQKRLRAGLTSSI